MLILTSIEGEAKSSVIPAFATVLIGRDFECGFLKISFNHQIFSQGSSASLILSNSPLVDKIGNFEKPKHQYLVMLMKKHGKPLDTDLLLPEAL